MQVTGPLFVPPGAEQGLPWVAILPIAAAVPAVVLLVLGLIRGRRLPAAIGAAAMVLPIAAYSLASMYVMEGSKDASFCGSCHVMTPLLQSLDQDDGSLAAVHYRRGLVPHEQACYTCHSGYGIWGTMDAKMAGLMHMVRTVTGDYALPIKLNAPFDIDSCLGCHAAASRFRDQPAHQDPDLQKALVAREMSCTGVCHPAAHPEAALTGGLAAR